MGPLRFTFNKVAAGGMTECYECGQIPIGAHSVTLRGERRCSTHQSLHRCHFCGWQSGSTQPGWMRLSSIIESCPKCSISSVVDPSVARKQVTKVRTDLLSMGFALKSRVKISFVDESQFSLRIGADPAIAQPVLGETRAFVTEGLVFVDVRDVLMLQGLPALWFARTLVHENMHAWILENHIQVHDLMLLEGLCETLSIEWLRRQRGSLPAALAEQILRSPDPIYGEGLRTVLSACSTGSLFGELDNLAARKLQVLTVS